MMKKEKLLTALKSLTINWLDFKFKSPILPKELQQDVVKPGGTTFFHPLTFAHFLKILCCFRQHSSVACMNALYDLALANKVILRTGLLGLQTTLFIGIAAQMMGLTDIAKNCFEIIAEHDINNYTSAAGRLNGMKLELTIYVIRMYESYTLTLNGTSY